MGIAVQSKYFKYLLFRYTYSMSEGEKQVCEYCIKVAYYACMTPKIRMGKKRLLYLLTDKKKDKK